jgi:hypothetical protein
LSPGITTRICTAPSASSHRMRATLGVTAQCSPSAPVSMQMRALRIVSDKWRFQRPEGALATRGKAQEGSPEAKAMRA